MFPSYSVSSLNGGASSAAFGPSLSAPVSMSYGYGYGQPLLGSAVLPSRSTPYTSTVVRRPSTSTMSVDVANADASPPEATDTLNKTQLPSNDVDTVEVTRYVPKIEIQTVERVVEVPQIQTVERTVEVPTIQTVDKFVEVEVDREYTRYVPKVTMREIPYPVHVPVAAFPSSTMLAPPVTEGKDDEDAPRTAPAPFVTSQSFAAMPSSAWVTGGELPPTSYSFGTLPTSTEVAGMPVLHEMAYPTPMPALPAMPAFSAMPSLPAMPPAMAMPGFPGTGGTHVLPPLSAGEVELMQPGELFGVGPANAPLLSMGSAPLGSFGGYGSFVPQPVPTSMPVGAMPAAAMQGAVSGFLPGMQGSMSGFLPGMQGSMSGFLPGSYVPSPLTASASALTHPLTASVSHLPMMTGAMTPMMPPGTPRRMTSGTVVSSTVQPVSETPRYTSNSGRAQQIVETVVEVPQVVTEEKVVHVPTVIQQERITHVPVVSTQERVVEIPKINWKETIVEVPQTQDRYVPMPVAQPVTQAIAAQPVTSMPVQAQAVLASPMYGQPLAQAAIAQAQAAGVMVSPPLYGGANSYSGTALYSHSPGPMFSSGPLNVSYASLPPARIIAKEPSSAPALNPAD